MIEIRQIRYFSVLAEEQHFGNAAARLDITQPALSQQIAALERSLGFQLFARTSRRVVPTEAGQRLRAAAERISGAETALRAAAARRGAPAAVRLGWQLRQDGELLARALEQQQPDDVACVLVRLPDGSVRDHLERARADVVLVRGAVPAGCVASAVLAEDAWCAVVPATWPAASEGTVRLPDLSVHGLAWVTDRPDAPLPAAASLAAPPGQTSGVVPTADMHALAGCGVAIGLATASTARSVADHGVRYVPLSDIAPDVVRLVCSDATAASVAERLAGVVAGASASTGRVVADDRLLAG